jgi:hypothetical protein
MFIDRTSLLRWLAARDPLPIEPLEDPVIDTLGHDPRSAYVETYWLPLLGPSSVWLLRRIADWFDDSPSGFPLAVGPAAAALGLGQVAGTNSPIVRTLGRLVIFEMAMVRGESLAVRRLVPPLARRHAARLPGHLADRHRAEQEAHGRLVRQAELRAVGVAER